MENKQFLIENNDIQYIEIYKDEVDWNVYDDLKKFKNAEIIDEDTDEEHIRFYTINKNKLQTTEINQKNNDEIENNKATIIGVATILQYLQNTELPNLVRNAIEALGFDLNNTNSFGKICETLLDIYNNDNLKISDSKALVFYQNNTNDISNLISNEARDLQTSESILKEEILNGPLGFYKNGINDRERVEEFAVLGKYAIFRIAQNFDSFVSYDLRYENNDVLNFDAEILKKAENLVNAKQLLSDFEDYQKAIEMLKTLTIPTENKNAIANVFTALQKSYDKNPNLFEPQNPYADFSSADLKKFFSEKNDSQAFLAILKLQNFIANSVGLEYKTTDDYGNLSEEVLTELNKTEQGKAIKNHIDYGVNEELIDKLDKINNDGKYLNLEMTEITANTTTPIKRKK